MRVRRGTTQHVIHALDETVRHDMLQLLGLVVNFRPTHSHDLDEEQLDEPVAAQNQHRELFTSRRQAHSAVRLIPHQARLGQRLHHCGGRPWRDAEGVGDLPHRDQVVGQQGDFVLIDGLQVVLDRARGQHA